MTPEERKAFKERMKQLKAYRELNPGRGYWDFVAENKEKDSDWGYQHWKSTLPENLQHESADYDLYGAYKAGLEPELVDDGSYHLGSRDPNTGRILKSKNHPTFKLAIEADIQAGYYPYEKNGLTYTKALSPVGDPAGYYEDDAKAYLPGGEIGDDDKELKRSLNIAAYILKYRKPLTDDSNVINDYSSNILWTMENPTNRGFKDGLYYPYTDKGVDGVTRKNIGPGFESHSNIAKLLKYDESTGYSKDFLTGLASEDLRKATPKIVESINRMNNGEYYGVWDTLSTGPKMIIYDIYHNVKHNNKKNLPEKWPSLIKALAEGDLEEAKKQTYSGSTRRQKMRNELLKYGDIDGVNNYAGGGETGDTLFSPYPEFVNGLRVNRWTGQPIATGNLDPIFSVRDAADFTPVGDALAANDAYHAVLNRDWLGAGLSALAMVPYIPMVNKNYVSNTIERMLSKNARNAHKATELNNETYEVVQRLTDDPSYMERANLVKELFGDDYTKVYADLIDAYNNNPDLLPKAKATEFDTRANGRMAATADAAKRHEEGGDFPGLGEYEYLFAKDADLPEGITVHENNHFVDFLKNKTKHADGNSNMFHLMSKDLKSGIDKMDRYYSNLSELKAYMNQVREYMYKKGIISSRNAKVDADSLKKIIKHLPSYMNAAKRASQQFKSMKSYAKWFNSVPLLGLGTLVMNRSQAKQENTNI